MEKDTKRLISRVTTSKSSAFANKSICGSGSSSGLTTTSSRKIASARSGASSSFLQQQDPSGTANATDIHGSRSNSEEVKRIYDHFHALGMPREITMEVFERLFNAGSREEGDKLKDTFRLLSQRLVGRQEAIRARGVIARAREKHAISKVSRPTSKLKAPTAGASKHKSSPGDTDPNVLLEDPMKVALARRETACRDLAGVKKEYESVRNEMQKLDAQKKQLEMSLEERRRILLLMNVLEKRETVRLTRFSALEGMGKVVVDLRKQVDIAVKNFLDVISNSESFEIPRSVNARETMRRVALERQKEDVFKYKHTAGALANLHAHHLRLSRADRDSTLASREDVEMRLEQVLSRLWLSDDPERIEKMKAKLIDVARRRAEKRIRFSGNAEKQTTTDLNEIQRKIEEKVKRVQGKINRAVALGWLCEEYIDLISTFRLETAKALNAMLEDERKRVHGYVDVLLAKILSLSQSTSASWTKLGSGEAQPKAFEEEVRDIVGSSRVAFWEDVKALVERVAESEDIMRNIRPVERKEEIEDIGYELDFEHVLSASAERSRKLLRKSKKAEYGFEVAKKIRALLDGVRKLK